MADGKSGNQNQNFAPILQLVNAAQHGYKQNMIVALPVANVLDAKLKVQGKIGHKRSIG